MLYLIYLNKSLKKIMLINASNEYVFKIIDSPVVPEKKIKPSRLIIIMIGAFLGFMLATLIVIFQNSFFKNRIFSS